MEVFRKLEIVLPSGTASQFIAAVENHLGNGWSRDRSAEEGIRRISGRETQVCLTWAGSEQLPAASLWIADRGGDALYVTNIVPAKVGQLTRSQYNSILLLFYETSLKVAAGETGAQLHLGGDTTTVDQALTGQVAAALKKFSVLANKSTGSGHPNDMERWCAFVVAAHRTNCDLDGHTLGRLLREELGWTEEVASRLISEYEFSRDLLKYYDEYVSEQ